MHFSRCISLSRCNSLSPTAREAGKPTIKCFPKSRNRMADHLSAQRPEARQFPSRSRPGIAARLFQRPPFHDAPSARPAKKKTGHGCDTQQPPGQCCGPGARQAYSNAGAHQQPASEYSQGVPEAPARLACKQTPWNPRSQLGLLTIALGVLREARLRRRPPGYGAEGLPLAARGHTKALRTPASATATKAEAGPRQAEAGL
jgi:hypothetical protein